MQGRRVLEPPRHTPIGLASRALLLLGLLASCTEQAPGVGPEEDDGPPVGEREGQPGKADGPAEGEGEPEGHVAGEGQAEEEGQAEGEGPAEAEGLADGEGLAEPEGAAEEEGAEEPIPDPATSCELGASRCGSDGRTIELCDGAGDWLPQRCGAACQEGLNGAHCTGQWDTRLQRVRLTYATRASRTAELTGWGPAERRVAAGVLAVSFHLGQNVDFKLTSDAGEATLAVADPAAPGDVIQFLAARPTADGQRFAWAVIEPAVPSGYVDSTVTPAPAGLWFWDLPLAEAPARGELHLTEEAGGGAMVIFQDLRRALEPVAGALGQPSASLVAWFKPGTWWSCGACYWQAATPPLTLNHGQPFSSQLFVPASSEGREYHADAMVFHEVGHFVMQTYGLDPAEGGPHYSGCPTFPGQAWAEGWATWFSASLRDDPRYVASLWGDLFWFDLAARRYGDGTPWVRPTADHPAGVLQPLEENEVAALLWALSERFEPRLHFHFLHALADPRMTEPPFGRGYTRRSWSMAPACGIGEVWDSGVNVPTFPDFLDTLLCRGAVTPETLDRLLVPDRWYPYDSRWVQCPR